MVNYFIIQIPSLNILIDRETLESFRILFQALNILIDHIISSNIIIASFERFGAI